MKNRIHKYFSTKINIPNKIDFVGLYFDNNGFRVHVTEFAKKNALILEIDFGFDNLAQRSMDEGNYLNLSWRVEKESKPLGPIVIVEHSDFLDWFLEESCDIYDKDKIKHIAILTQNEWVEVICEKLPEIRLLDA